MKCLDDHHSYQPEDFENEPEVQSAQALNFIKKEPVAEGSTELRTVQNGTTNEEVLRVILHRMNGLQSKFPCRENAIAITHIETALLWLDHRTANRKNRGVEGTSEA